jgi:hypothetical protein
MFHLPAVTGTGSSEGTQATTPATTHTHDRRPTTNLTAVPPYVRMEYKRIPRILAPLHFKHARDS